MIILRYGSATGAAQRTVPIPISTVSIVKVSSNPLDSFANYIVSGAKSVADSISGGAKTVGSDIVGGAVSVGKDTSTVIYGGVATVKKDISSGASSIYGGITTIGKKVSSDISGAINKAGSSIGYAGYTAGKNLIKGFTTGVSDISKSLPTVENGILTTAHDLGAAGQDVTNAFNKAGSTVANDLSGGLSGILGFFEKYWWVILAIIVGIIALFIYIYARGSHVTGIAI